MVSSVPPTDRPMSPGSMAFTTCSQVLVGSAIATPWTMPATVNGTRYTICPMPTVQKCHEMSFSLTHSRPSSRGRM